MTEDQKFLEEMHNEIFRLGLTETRNFKEKREQIIYDYNTKFRAIRND